MGRPAVVSRDHHDAVIFDLDGVITRTARVHARAWKQVFDACLERRSAERGEPFVPFDERVDYLRHVDGKPRSDGVRDFLASRGIVLPEGDSGDPPGTQSVCGIGDRKNERFLELLGIEGVAVYEHAKVLVRRVREAGLRTAIVSSSKNCGPVLESVGALDLFDAKVDGNDSEKRQLAGKPAPDIYLAAADALGVEPGRAVVVEDARSGVAAARSGGFALVIGVDRGGQRDALLTHGADVVVTDLSQVEVAGATGSRRDDPAPDVPRAEAIEHGICGRQPAVFLDYDGTLTPIVQRPELAVLDEAMRTAVRRLAALCPVAVISGRDLDDVRTRVGLDDIHYAGSHGFDIAGPGGLRHEHPAGVAALPRLDAAERHLRDALGPVTGVLVDRKRFSIAVHFRRVAGDDASRVEQAVDTELRRVPGLRKGHGKKVFELRPDVDWDKGSAVRWLLEALDLARDDVVPVYIGDDVTDEDAFRELARCGDGIGIAVMDSPRPTAAKFYLRDPEDVRSFLGTLADLLEARA
jgi:trehalose 6-phosphate phosphatase